MWDFRSRMCRVFFFAAFWLMAEGVSAPVLAKDISAALQSVTPKQFQSTLARQLRTQFPMQNVDFSVRVLFPRQPIQVPQGQLDIQWPPDTMNGRTGRRAFRGSIHIDSQFERMVNVVAEISAHTQVVAPVRFIKAREIVQPEAVSLIDVALPSLHHDFLQDEELVIGKKALRLLPPNLPIQRPYLVAPPVIRKGDRVVLEVRQGSLLVQTVGIAKDSGEPGKTIAVQNQTSGREVIGKIVNAGLVEVLF